MSAEKGGGSRGSLDPLLDQSAPKDQYAPETQGLVRLGRDGAEAERGAAEENRRGRYIPVD